MSKRFIFTIITLIVIAGAAIAAVFLAKGYTFSPGQKRVVGTGIISVNSVPEGASVYIDGHLTTATNTTVPQLSPRTYHIKIAKEGFISWEKDVEVKEGLVSDIKATLFPSIPTVYPLTYNGILNPLLSPDGQNLAFEVPISSDSGLRQKGGVWVWTMSSQPIAISRGAQPHQVLISDTNLDFSKATLKWSPDSKQLLVTLPKGTNGSTLDQNFLLPADQLTTAANLRDITPTLEAALKSWTDDQKSKDLARVAAIVDPGARQVASSAANLKWSPDETKFMFGGTPSATLKPSLGNTKDAAKVYDLETKKQYSLPDAKSYIWLSDSLHIVLVMDDKIAICDLDGSNVAVIYAGKFDNGYVFPWPDASRLAIVSSYATPTASRPNLLGINIK